MTPVLFLKVATIAVCLAGVTSPVLASNREIQQSLQEIGIAKDQTEIVFQQSRDRDTRERMRYTQDRLTAAEQLLQNVLRNGGGNGGGGNRPPRFPGGRQVELFRSDSCSGSLVGILRENMNCTSFATSSVWGMKIDGVCYDVKDMNGAEICQNFPAIHNPRATEIYRSDSCRGELTAMVDPSTTCSSLSAGFSAWGVKIGGGTCQDINDDSLVSACQKFQ